MKTAKLLNSDIFINKQVNNEIRDKIEVLEKIHQINIFLGKILILQSPRMDLFNIKIS